MAIQMRSKLVKDICWKPLVLEFFNSRNLGNTKIDCVTWSFSRMQKRRQAYFGRLPSLIGPKRDSVWPVADVTFGIHHCRRSTQFLLGQLDLLSEHDFCDMRRHHVYHMYSRFNSQLSLCEIQGDVCGDPFYDLRISCCAL